VSKVDEREEGRGLLGEVTVTLETGVDDLDPRRLELQRWLAAHTDTSGRDLAEAKLVAPAWPEPWGLNASVEYQLVIDEELRRAGVRRPINPIGIGWAGPTILVAGTE
jgi:alkylation response protein AidB-like acyl-CoA dehydrogenase